MCGRLMKQLVNLVLASTLVSAANAPNAAWKTETIEKASGRGVSLAVDKEGNLHVSYAVDTGEIRYGFRPTGSSRWFTMNIDTGYPWDPRGSGMFTRIAVDHDGNPQICFTGSGPIHYASYQGGKWHVGPIDSPGSAFACGIAIAPDGTVHLSWYQEKDPRLTEYYLHLKYAVLKNDAWLLKTIDFDTATGKWNQLVLDSHGYPRISYSAWVSAQTKYALWDGKQWRIIGVDAPPKTQGLGMGNSLALDAKDQAHISYYDEHFLKYARQSGTTWSIEQIDSIAPRGLEFEDYRSSIALNSHGLPYISYEDSGFVKCAHYDGQKWDKQVVAPSGTERYLFDSIGIGPDDSVYIAYRDPITGAVVLSTLKHGSSAVAATSSR
jgi:hypothetical protein